MRREAGHHSVWKSSSTSASPGGGDAVQRLEPPLEAAADVLAQREDALVGDRVAGVVALLPPPHDSGRAEHAEVFRDVLLGGPDQRGQLEHGRLALAQVVEELDPRRLAQHAKALRDQLDEVVWKGMGRAHAGVGPARWWNAIRPLSCGPA